MERFIRKSWWKWAGVLIIVLVFIVGLLTPLKPGITLVTPTMGNGGEELVVNISGYNTHFDEAEDSIRIWLKMDQENALAAQRIDVESATQLSATFQVPKYLPAAERAAEFAVVMDNALDGPSALSGALVIRQDSIDPGLAGSSWAEQPIADLHGQDAFSFPFLNIIEESIRNLYFHVALWFAMVLLLLGSMIASIRYLRQPAMASDHWASSLASTGILFGVLGLATGAVWARYTWGAFWSWDIKQVTTLIALMIYLAYFALRSAFPDEERRGRVSAVYNVFAFVAMLILIGVLPRLPSVESLHPGNGGNPGLGGQDLDNAMRKVFYPAIIGWALIGLWMASLRYRILRLDEQLWDQA